MKERSKKAGKRDIRPGKQGLRRAVKSGQFWTDVYKGAEKGILADDAAVAFARSDPGKQRAL